jgi:hypothetical protein
MKDAVIYYPKSSAEAVGLAAQELGRCLKEMTRRPLSVRSCTEFPSDDKPAFWVGGPDAFREQVKPDPLDDETLVTQRDGACLITGSNPRSVLFAVYAALERLGARWVGTGEAGEYLPEASIDDMFRMDMRQRASYRHRGICIEGAPSLDHALGIIDWMTKKRMNSFFLQFKTSIYFWQNWYHHDYNDGYMEPRKIDEAASLEMDEQVIRELRRRGLVFHRVGHGWTAESIGLKGLGWYQFEGEISPEQRALMAEVDGKRGLFGGIPINTELCYSNQRAFDAVVDHVVDYAGDHPEVDCLHFWLSDAPNNFCECPQCRERTQSDHYLRLVKAVSKRLKEKDISTRIVFLCYTNTLTAPVIEELGPDVDNVIFMFAPISRCYQHPLTDGNCESGAQAGGWELNKIRPPRTNKEFVDILRNWQRKYSGDSFIFDYYLWRPFLDHLNPLGLSRVVSRDVKDLNILDLNGLMSCQALRCFYPLGLVMNVMAETLWDRDVGLSDVVNRHLGATCGSAAGMVRKYLEELEESLHQGPDAHVGTLRPGDEDSASALLNLLDRWEERITAWHRDSQDSSEGRYAYNLVHYHNLLRLKAQAILCRSKGDDDQAKRYADAAADHIKRAEGRLHSHLDAWLALRTVAV